MMATQFNLQKILKIVLCLLPLLIANTLYAETVNAEETQPSTTTSEEPEKEGLTELSRILDPTQRQFMGGQLSYWFKDYSGALKAWQPLAEEGHAPSQATLGWLYHRGLGVEQDYQRAVKWYRLAADQDYVVAQHNLGIMYENGWGVEQSYTEALKWYLIGAEKAYGNSLFNLGLFYLNGLGVEKDQDKAIHLLKSAHQMKVDEAAAVLQPLGVTVEVEEPINHNPQPMRHRIGLPNNSNTTSDQ